MAGGNLREGETATYLARRGPMAQPLDPNALVTFDELALSTMWETSALVELLERKGILTKQEVLDMIQELRRRDPTAIRPGRLNT